MSDPTSTPSINLDPATFEALRLALGVPKITNSDGKPFMMVTTWYKGLPNKPFTVVSEE